MTYADCKSAFQSANLQPLQVLKLALAHSNFMDAADAPGCPSSEAIDQAIAVCRHWPDWTLQFGDDLLWKGTRTREQIEVWFVRTARSLFHDTEVEAAFAEEKVQEFLRREGLRTVWVTDGVDDEGNELDPESCPALELHHALGLYGRQLAEGEQLVISRATCDDVFRPTVADAGAAFYWRQGPDNVPHGRTVHLETGKPTLHEWVTAPSALEGNVRSCVLKLVDAPLDTTDGGLPPDYWAAGRTYVRLCREHHGIDD